MKNNINCCEKSVILVIKIVLTFKKIKNSKIPKKLQGRETSETRCEGA